MADQQDPKDQKAENQPPAQPTPEMKQGAAPVEKEQMASPEEKPATEPQKQEPPKEQPAEATPQQEVPQQQPPEQQEQVAPPPKQQPEQPPQQAEAQQEAPQQQPPEQQAGQKPAKEGSVMPDLGKMPEFMKKGKDQPKTTGEERVWALLSYLPLVALVALVMKPDSDYVKLHGRQGLLIFLIFFFAIFAYIVPFVGVAIGIIVHLACVGIALFSMYQAFIGNFWKIPVLGDVAEMIPVEAFTKVTRTAVMGEKVEAEQREEAAEATEQEEQQEAEAQPEQQPPQQEKPAETPPAKQEGPGATAESGEKPAEKP